MINSGDMYLNGRGYRSARLKKWYISIVMVLIPLLVFSISVNAVTRIADIYQNQIDKVQEQAASEHPGDAVLFSEMGIYVDSDILSSEISDFMKHKSKTISTLEKDNEMYDFYVTTKAEFTDNDYRILKKIRTFDDLILIIGILGGIWSLLMCFYMVREGYETKAQLRKIFKKSLLVQAVLQAIVFISVMVGAVSRFINGKLLKISLNGDELLPKILGNGTVTVMALAELALAVIITAIIFYILWIVTKPRDIFNERRYFR